MQFTLRNLLSVNIFAKKSEKRADCTRKCASRMKIGKPNKCIAQQMTEDGRGKFKSFLVPIFFLFSRVFFPSSALEWNAEKVFCLHCNALGNIFCASFSATINGMRKNLELFATDAAGKLKLN